MLGMLYRDDLRGDVPAGAYKIHWLRGAKAGTGPRRGGAMKPFLEQWNPTVAAAFVPGMRITSLFQQRKQNAPARGGGAQSVSGTAAAKSRGTTFAPDFPQVVTVVNLLDAADVFLAADLAVLAERVKERVFVAHGAEEHLERAVERPGVVQHAEVRAFAGARAAHEAAEQGPRS